MGKSASVSSSYSIQGPALRTSRKDPRHRSAVVLPKLPRESRKITCFWKPGATREWRTSGQGRSAVRRHVFRNDAVNYVLCRNIAINVAVDVDLRLKETASSRKAPNECRGDLATLTRTSRNADLQKNSRTEVNQRRLTRE